MMKIMAGNQGTSFMEDYTYHLQKGNEMVLGSHMLEICPSLAADRPRIEVHPLFVGGKEAPARLIFNGASGTGINATLVDMGDRFRLIVNEVNAVQNEHRMPHLPVARLLWQPEPSLTRASEAWILAGVHITSPFPSIQQVNSSGIGRVWQGSSALSSTPPAP